MPNTKTIKTKPVEATTQTLQRAKPVKVRAVNGAQSELKVPAVRRNRASSCPRCPDRCVGRTGAHGTSCERRARSSSIATKTPREWPRTNPDYRRTTTGSVNSREVSAGPGQREQQGVKAETSHKAFTVIPPNPKRRREIQRKAEAELAALEELRLNRAMAYVSINPSSVGGCLSLEEVRLKQQQEMMQAKRKQKPMFQKQTPVLRC